MTVYVNECGKFAITISEPHPMWAEVRIDGDRVPGHLTSADLYDLKHLIDRAIIAAEAKERDIDRLRGRSGPQE